MGYDTVQFRVVGSVSRHNSDRDREHDALWEELTARITEVCGDPRYQPLGVLVLDT